MIILQANKFMYEKGGSERYMFALSHALSGRGHQIVPFAMQDPRNAPSPFARYFVPHRDYTASAPVWRRVPDAVRFIRSPAAARCLGRLLDEIRPDVAHLHNIYHQLTPSIIELLAARNIPMVMTLHDYKLVCASYTLFARGEYCYRCRGGHFYHAVAVACGGSRARSALLAAESYWQRWTKVYDRVYCFVAPSRFMQRVMVEGGFDARRVVYVPQFGSPWNADAGAGADSALLDRLPPRYVAYIGRLSREKGVVVLLEAMAGLPGIPLVVFGDGPNADALRRHAGDRGLEDVHFVGHASHATLAAARSRAVAVVLPSLWPENAPLSAMEATAAGVPTIVSNMGGLPEMAEQTGGCVVPAGDARALAAAIREVWNHEDEWRSRAASAWDRARVHQSVETHVDAIESIYENARSGRPVEAPV